MQTLQQPPSLEDEPIEDDDSSTLLTRFGTAIGGAVTASIVSSLPAVLRMGDGGSSVRADSGIGSSPGTVCG